MRNYAPTWVWIIAGIILILVLFILLGHPIKVG
jgi:uncharacterized integral membrane protein